MSPESVAATNAKHAYSMKLRSTREFADHALILPMSDISRGAIGIIGILMMKGPPNEPFPYAQGRTGNTAP